MGLKDFMHNTVLRMDLLSTSPGFRVRSEPNYETVFGGIFSFLIMGGFGYVLYLQFISMFNNLQITYSQGLSDDVTSDTSITSLQMAVSIDGIDFSSNTKKFMYFLKQKSIQSVNGTPTIVSTPIRLTPCQLSEWQNVGNNFKQQFQAFGFDKMLCIQSGQNYTLSGYIGSSNYNFLTFEIVQCNATVDPSCDSAGNINTYMTNYLSNNDYFNVRFFLVDTIVTPDSDDPITYVIEKNIFMAFTNTIGTVGYINMAEWTLETDSNPLPVTTYTETTGSYIQTFQTNSVSISSTKYVTVNLYKSTKSMTITRTIGKIDVVLSYVGGLFGLIFTGIAFFIGSYSEMKYEIYVAEQTLKVDQTGKRVTESDFGFLTYLAYSCYDWLDSLGLTLKCLEWLGTIHDVRDQVCEQLNPIVILKRIKYLEDVSRVLLDQHKQLTLHLSQPPTLQQARRMRQTLEYYDKALLQIGRDGGENSVRDEKNCESSNANAVCNVDSIREEKKELSEQQEEQLLQSLMLQAYSQLQKDNSDIGKKIKERISRRTRTLFREIKNQKQLITVQYENQMKSPMSPYVDIANDSANNLKKNDDKAILRVQRKK